MDKDRFKKELQGQIDGLGLRNIELKGFSDDIHKEYMESSLFFYLRVMRGLC